MGTIKPQQNQTDRNETKETKGFQRQFHCAEASKLLGFGSIKRNVFAYPV